MSEAPAPLRRRLLAALALGVLAPAVRAQVAKAGMQRLGILGTGTRAVDSKVWAPLLQHLASLGFREGTGFAVEWRFTEGNPVRLEAMARELAASKVTVATTVGTLATRALQSAAPSLPIVTGGVADPVLGGFAKSLVRPGGNVTGLSLGGTDIAQLQLSLLRALVPRISRLAILRGAGHWADPEITNSIAAMATQAGITPESLVVSDVSRLESILRGLRGPGVGAAFVIDVDHVSAAQFAELATRHRIATMFADRRWVSAGGLMSYNLYHEDRMRRIAALLGKALRGENPAGIPFELPTISEFVLNQRTATALGLSIPADVLLRADEVIE